MAWQVFAKEFEARQRPCYGTPAYLLVDDRPR